MATVLEEYPTEEQPFVVQKDSTQRIFIKKCFPFTVGSVCRVMLLKLSREILSRTSRVADDARSSRPVEIATEATVQWMEELIRADRRVRIDIVATALVWSHGLAYSTVHYHLKLRKVCARWVPRELKDREKINRMGLSLQHLLRYAD
jgi:hypothetical protein